MGHRSFECYMNREGNPQSQNRNEGNNGNKSNLRNNGNNQNNNNRNNGNNQTQNNSNRINSQGCIYVMNRVQAEAGDVVTGIFSAKSTPVYVLFDSGATNSFVSTTYARKVGWEPTSEVRIAVKTPTGSVVACRYLHKDVPIKINSIDFLANLIEFELKDIDVVLGMDWLGKYKAKIICAEQKVILRSLEGKYVAYKGATNRPGIKLVSAMEIVKHVVNGQEAYLCMVKDLNALEDAIEQIPMVKEFPDVFPEEIPGMPPEREVEFTIDLMLGTTPISKTP
ncbi:probable serine/threonine-protein kinase roco11 [Ipomoea triloba]|uniref:probable serine/threonine-protein kinase roco11 n=1 Tax=Ipomoea triloba TaxID=35885 RepID=UPI00125D1CBC|nr:probable serine/threonine-protein kinase roco11 [Ipomoea triloba]